MTEFLTATDLEQAGYARHRLNELFGEPDTSSGTGGNTCCTTRAPCD